MARFKSIRWEPIPDSQRNHFLQWMFEWNLDQKLREGEEIKLSSEPELRSVQEAGNAPSIAKFDPNINMGEIRLLPRYAVTEDSDMVFVAVLRKWPGSEEAGEMSYLVAPYSRFSVPANDDELLFEPETEPSAEIDFHRVLCLWNARTVGENQLGESWEVGRLEEASRQSALDIFHHFALGDDLPDELQDRVGPPIALLEDPRLEYLQEESARLWGFSSLRDNVVPATDRHDKPENLIALDEYLNTSIKSVLSKEKWAASSKSFFEETTPDGKTNIEGFQSSEGTRHLRIISTDKSFCDAEIILEVEDSRPILKFKEIEPGTFMATTVVSEDFVESLRKGILTIKRMT